MLLCEVIKCICIDKELHVKLFFKGSPVPLPLQCFRHRRDCRLSVAYLKNFANTNSKKDWCILLVLSILRYYYNTLLYNHTEFCRKISLYRQYRY